MKYLMAGIELDLASIKASYLPKWQELQNPYEEKAWCVKSADLKGSVLYVMLFYY